MAVLSLTCEDKFIKIWDRSTEKELKTLKEHSDSVSCLFPLPINDKGEDQLQLSSSNDKSCILWNISKNGRIEKTFIGHSSIVNAVIGIIDPEEISIGGRKMKLFATGSWDRTIKIWLIESRKFYARD